MAKVRTLIFTPHEAESQERVLSRRVLWSVLKVSGKCKVWLPVLMMIFQRTVIRFVFISSCGWINGWKEKPETV